MASNQTADTLFWAFGALASLWFMLCVAFRIGGEARAEYFVTGLVGAGVLWGCGWLLRRSRFDWHRLKLATLYDTPPPIGRDRRQNDRLHGKPRIKKIANRSDQIGSSKRPRRR
jgi:hypothetical protein